MVIVPSAEGHEEEVSFLEIFETLRVMPRRWRRRRRRLISTEKEEEPYSQLVEKDAPLQVMDEE